MNRHLAIKISCFSVVKLRNSPAITRVPRLESEYFNHNLLDPDLIRASLVVFFGLDELYYLGGFGLICVMGAFIHLAAGAFDDLFFTRGDQ